MEIENVPQSSVLSFIEEAAKSGKFFKVTFIKRSGAHEERTMLCRGGVSRYLKGGEPAYDPHSKKLVWVYDMQAHGYRSIPVEGVKRIQYRGHTILFEKGKVSIFAS